MRRALVASIAALVGVATACTGDANTRADNEPSIRTTDCPNEIAAVVLTELECGYLTVPEDRSDPGSRSIDVFYMRVQPAGRVVGEPYFSFGYEMAQVPSYASISPPGSSAQGNGPELILMDQRGVGHSAPSLACPEVEAVAPELVATSSDDREPFLDAVTECHRRLAGSGIDLSAYTTQAAADDADDLRRLLESSWNLISFGTSSRLLLETVRRHPDGIRALVMDSPQFPQVDDATSAADAIRSSLSNLERTCRQDKACDRAYPDLVSTFDEALARLDDSPETVSVELGGERRSVVVDGGALVRVIRHLLSFNDAGAHGAIPSIVYAARDGHVDAIAGVLARDPGMCVGYLPRCIFPTSLGAYLSFTCSGRCRSSMPRCSSGRRRNRGSPRRTGRTRTLRHVRSGTSSPSLRGPRAGQLRCPSAGHVGRIRRVRTLRPDRACARDAHERQRPRCAIPRPGCVRYVRLHARDQERVAADARPITEHGVPVVDPGARLRDRELAPLSR